MFKLIDTHAHIYDEQYNNDFNKVMEEIENELDSVVMIGCDLETSLESVKLSNEYNFVYATVGVHPMDISKYNDEVEKKLEKLATNEKKVVAIGEIGLDYYWMNDPKEVQKAGFRKLMKLAERVKKPVVIHTREALFDTIEILNEFPNVGGILHCYPGSFEAAKPLLDRYFIGIGGTLTFKNNKKTKELVRVLPLEKIVIETDSPYLTPTPFRGKRNHPIYTKYVAEEIARIKEIAVEEVIKVTTENAKKIYRID